MVGADFTRTCEGCEHVVAEPWIKDTLAYRGFTPGVCRGYIVGIERFNPYIPAYVVFDFKTGAFAVRTRTQTLTDNEVGGFVGEVVSAAILSNFVERADPDRPKGAAPAASATASPLVNMLRAAFLRAANNKTAPAADKPAEAADAPEVVE